VGANGKRKTGHPAPSADLLRMAVDLLPNDAGHFDDRAKWARVAYAINGAAIEGGFEAEGKELLLAFCARYSGDCDLAEDERVWDSIRDTHTGWGTLMRTLERMNPTGREAVRAEEARLAFAVQTAAIQSVGHFNPANLPPRRWLYGNSVIAGFISMLVAPGGTGKSALAMVEAVAMATGRELLPGEYSRTQRRVWYHNIEDDGDEMHRRLAAIKLHHKVSSSDLADRLILTSGRSLDIKLARRGRQGAEINRVVVDCIVEMLQDAKTDVLMLDPLGALHELSENSNEDANMLMGVLREIADRASAAIVLIHHTSKVAANDMGAAGAGASRGASAFVDAARSVRQLARMKDGDAKKFGVPTETAWQYVRVDNGKANLAPAQNAKWLRLVSVNLGNGTADYPDGDNIQTVERWTPPTAATQGAITAGEVSDIQNALNAADPDARRKSSNADSWVGYRVADALGLTLDAPGTAASARTADGTFNRNRVNAVIEAGLDAGWLQVLDEKGADRKPHSCVASGNRTPTDAADVTQPSTSGDA